MRDEDCYDDYDPRNDCDCSDPEWDLLEGTAHCWHCGRRWFLTSKEIDDYWRGQRQFEHDMERQRFWDRVGHLWWKVQCFFSRKPTSSAHRFESDDDIPF